MNASRAAGNLAVADKLRATLTLYRLRRGITAPPLLELGDVRAVETKLGTRVPDAVWAWLAATGRDPHQVLTLTADAREEAALPRRFVAFGCDRRDGVYYCVERDAHGMRCCSVWEWQQQQAAERWHDVASFVRARHDLAVGPLAHGLYESERARFERELAAFWPALAETEAHQQQARCVSHPRFGHGVVVRELPGPPAKLEIDFGSLGRKLLLATFVQEHRDAARVGVVGNAQVAPLPDRPSSVHPTLPPRLPKRPPLVRPAA